MADNDYLPKGQDELLTFARNAAAKLEANPEMFGVTADQAAELDERVRTFGLMMARLGDPMTFSRGNVGLKDDAKAAAQSYLREVVQFSKANPAVSDAALEEIGVRRRSKGRTRVEPPKSRPGVAVKGAYGSTLLLRLFDPASPTRRARPSGVATATLMWAHGPTPPASPSGWQFLTTTSSTSVTAQFPASLPAGTTVWVVAFWANRRGQSGPVCLPESANLPGGAAEVRAAAEPAPMKIAA